MAIYQYPFRDADEATKRAVWNKGRIIPGYDANVWRCDACNSVIYYADHGNTGSKHGWEIDHIVPTAKGGRTVMDNLQPLQWETNRRKGDQYPWSCNS